MCGPTKALRFESNCSAGLVVHWLIFRPGHGDSYREQMVIPVPAVAVAQRAQQVLTDAPRVSWVKVQPHESQPDLVQA